MNCVFKEYENKIVMTTAKNEIFIELQHENCYVIGE